MSQWHGIKFRTIQIRYLQRLARKLCLAFGTTYEGQSLDRDSTNYMKGQSSIILKFDLIITTYK